MLPNASGTCTCSPRLENLRASHYQEVVSAILHCSGESAGLYNRDLFWVIVLRISFVITLVSYFMMALNDAGLYSPLSFVFNLRLYFFSPRATIEAAGLHEIFVVVVLVPVRFSSAVLTQTGFIGG